MNDDHRMASAKLPTATPRRSRAGGWLAAVAMVVAVVLSSGVVGCGGGGTDPGSAAVLSGPNSVQVVDSSGLLRDHEASIRSLAATAVAQATAALPITGVSIVVMPDASRSISGWGIGGRTFSATRIEIYIDPAYPGLSSALAQRLPSLVVHELHHAMRWRGPGYGRTLLEAMVSEGLADAFALQVTAAAAPPWTEAFADAQTDQYLALARPEFDSSSYSHDRWFFEAGAPTLPRWTGYTLGLRLVQRYLAAHPGATAASLVDTVANAFRPL